MEVNNYNQSGASFDSNNISSDDWATMESFGVVFLPLAGTRNR